MTAAACPRCKSANPAVPNRIWRDDATRGPCPHKWHDRPTGADPYGSTDERECHPEWRGHPMTEAEVLAHRAPDGTVILEVKRPGGWVRVSLPLLEQMTADFNRVRKIEQENIKLRRKLNAVIDWTEATSEDENDPDWPLDTYEPYAAARNRVRSIIEEEQ